MKHVLFVLIFIVPISLFSQITLTPADLEGNWDYYLYGLKEKNPVVFKSDGFAIGIKKDGKKLKYVLENNVMVLYGWEEGQKYTRQEAIFALYPSKDKKTIKVKKFTPTGLADLNMKFVSTVKKTKPSTEPPIKNWIIDQFIGGDLLNREITKRANLSDPPASGIVVIKVCANRKGDLLETIFLTKGSSTTNKKLIQLAIDSAKLYRFNPKPSAPDRQCGTITFRFRSE